uniref:Uncharacterized protein n=1 Tax=Glossina austeni TaxID=7395 RepID=A0A1A9VVN6_GLOAU
MRAGKPKHAQLLILRYMKQLPKIAGSPWTRQDKAKPKHAQLLILRYMKQLPKIAGSPWTRQDKAVKKEMVLNLAFILTLKTVNLSKKLDENLGKHFGKLEKWNII